MFFRAVFKASGEMLYASSASDATRPDGASSQRVKRQKCLRGIVLNVPWTNDFSSRG
jgi:hypothetical protein